MTPYPLAETVPYTAVRLDPDSQQAVYVGPGGQPIEAGKHGTNKQTSRSLTTGGGDGQDPTPSDDTAATDYDSD
ncbi:putative ATP-grasp-modified RiPP [Sphaerisporangium sp. NPDC051011]|uniref:putative ATP-grasp-modified RiPP n=1 Tax=Sphaerisporangium sp. NPDC051011 TaxID=3155792 RepID=UPI0033CCF09F